MAQITCQSLTLGYGGAPIIENLSFSVSAGDYLCIVGENGSGKTTLLKTLLGLIKPLEGRVERSDNLLPCEIGYLSQQTPVQKGFPASVREIVLSGCQGRMGLRPFYTQAEKELAQKNLERLRIADLAERSYRELSGGQKQRVLLARALGAGQKVLFLDEPVCGLDPQSAASMYQIVRERNRSGVTVLMVTHDVQEAILHATHILHLGRTLFFGNCENYQRWEGNLFHTAE